jgi:hypothetical protein
VCEGRGLTDGNKDCREEQRGLDGVVVVKKFDLWGLQFEDRHSIAESVDVHLRASGGSRGGVSRVHGDEIGILLCHSLILRGRHVRLVRHLRCVGHEEDQHVQRQQEHDILSEDHSRHREAEFPDEDAEDPIKELGLELVEETVVLQLEPSQRLLLKFSPFAHPCRLHDLDIHTLVAAGVEDEGDIGRKPDGVDNESYDRPRFQLLLGRPRFVTDTAIGSHLGHVRVPIRGICWLAIKDRQCVVGEHEIAIVECHEVERKAFVKHFIVGLELGFPDLHVDCVAEIEQSNQQQNDNWGDRDTNPFRFERKTRLSPTVRGKDVDVEVEDRQRVVQVDQ